MGRQNSWLLSGNQKQGFTITTLDLYVLNEVDLRFIAKAELSRFRRRTLGRKQGNEHKGGCDQTGAHGTLL